ncbi:MAG: hypothetical protein ABIT01_19450 [Thermoanaerobaculia bacterium]
MRAPNFPHQRVERFRWNSILAAMTLVSAALSSPASASGSAIPGQVGPRSTLLLRWSYRLDPTIETGFHFILTALDPTVTSVLRTWTVSAADARRKPDGSWELVVVDLASTLPRELKYRLEVVISGGTTIRLGTCRGRSHQWTDRTSARGATLGALALSSQRVCALDAGSTFFLKLSRANLASQSRIDAGRELNSGSAIGRVRQLNQTVVPRRLPDLLVEQNHRRADPPRTWADWKISVPTPPPEVVSLDFSGPFAPDSSPNVCFRSTSSARQKETA